MSLVAKFSFFPLGRMRTHRLLYSSLGSFLFVCSLLLSFSPATSQPVDSVTSPPAVVKYDVADVDYHVEYYARNNAYGRSSGIEERKWVDYPNLSEAVKARNDEIITDTAEQLKWVLPLAENLWIVNKKRDGSGLLINVADTPIAFVKKSINIRYQGHGECVFDFSQTNTNERKALLFTDPDLAQTTWIPPAKYERNIRIRFFGITFRNIGKLGSHIVPGGLVWEHGNLYFERCKFENMQSSLVVSSGYLSMQGCEVRDSEEKDGEVSVEDGKLFQLTSSLEDSTTSGFVLKDNTFVNNKGSLVVVNGFLPAEAQDFVVERNYFAYNQGGTVFSVNAPALADGETPESEKVKEAKSRPILFRRNIFRKNTGAGTLVFSDVAHPVKLLGCQFYENESMNKGGAIFYSGTGALSLQSDSFYLGDVEDSSFVKNSAKGDGGAVYVAGRAEVEIADTLFEGNSCDGKGGGVYILPTTTEPLNSLEIAVSRCTFRDGRSGEEGAALVVERGSNRRVSLNQCLFERNVADFGASQVSLQVSEFAYVRECEFDGGVDSQYTLFRRSKGPQLYIKTGKKADAPFESPIIQVEKNLFRNVRVSEDVRSLDGDPRHFAPCVTFEAMGDYLRAQLLYNTAINTWAPYENLVPADDASGRQAFRLSNVWHIIGQSAYHDVAFEGNRWFSDDRMQYDCSADAPLPGRTQGGHPCMHRRVESESSLEIYHGVVDDHQLMCDFQGCQSYLYKQCSPQPPVSGSVCSTAVNALTLNPWKAFGAEKESIETALAEFGESDKNIVFRLRRSLSGDGARIKLPATSAQNPRRTSIRVYALVADVVLDYEGGEIFEYPEGEEAPSAPYDISFEGVTLRNARPLALRSVPGVQTIQTKVTVPFQGPEQRLQLGGDAEGGLLSLRNVVLEDFVGGCVKREATTAVGLQFQKVTFRRCGKESQALGGPELGGGLLMTSAGVEKDSFEDLVFEDCKAEKGGGAIAAVWPNRFEEDVSEWRWYHAAMSVKGLKITGCEAKHGGALNVVEGDLDVYNLEEMSNNYGEWVGAIYIGERGRVQLINDENAAMGKIFDNYASWSEEEWMAPTANVVMMYKGRGFTMRRQFIWNKDQHLHVNKKSGIFAHDYDLTFGTGLDWQSCHIKGLGGLDNWNEVAIRNVDCPFRFSDTIFEDLKGHICPMQVDMGGGNWWVSIERSTWINTRSDTDCVGVYDTSTTWWVEMRFDDWKYLDTSARIDEDGVRRSASLDDATCGPVDGDRNPHQKYLGEKIMLYSKISDIIPEESWHQLIWVDSPEGKVQVPNDRSEYVIKVKDMTCSFITPVQSEMGRDYEGFLKPEIVTPDSPRIRFGFEDYFLFHNSLMTNLKLLPQNRFIRAFQEHLPLLLARGMGKDFTLFVPPVVLFKEDGSDLDEEEWVQLCLSRMLKGTWTRQAISVQVVDDDDYNRQEYDNIPADSKYVAWAAQHYQSPRPSKVNVWETKAINGAPLVFRYNPDVDGNAAWTLNGETYLRTKPRRLGGGMIYFLDATWGDEGVVSKSDTVKPSDDVTLGEFFRSPKDPTSDRDEYLNIRKAALLLSRSPIPAGWRKPAGPQMFFIPADQALSNVTPKWSKLPSWAAEMVRDTWTVSNQATLSYEGLLQSLLVPGWEGKTFLMDDGREVRVVWPDVMKEEILVDGLRIQVPPIEVEGRLIYRILDDVKTDYSDIHQRPPHGDFCLKPLRSKLKHSDPSAEFLRNLGVGDTAKGQKIFVVRPHGENGCILTERRTQGRPTEITRERWSGEGEVVAVYNDIRYPTYLDEVGDEMCNGLANILIREETLFSPALRACATAWWPVFKVATEGYEHQYKIYAMMESEVMGRDVSALYAPGFMSAAEKNPRVSSRTICVNGRAEFFRNDFCTCTPRVPLLSRTYTDLAMEEYLTDASARQRWKLREGGDIESAVPCLANALLPLRRWKWPWNMFPTPINIAFPPRDQAIGSGVVWNSLAEKRLNGDQWMYGAISAYRSIEELYIEAMMWPNGAKIRMNDGIERLVTHDPKNNLLELDGKPLNPYILVLKNGAIISQSAESLDDVVGPVLRNPTPPAVVPWQASAITLDWSSFTRYTTLRDVISSSNWVDSSPISPAWVSKGDAWEPKYDNFIIIRGHPDSGCFDQSPVALQDGTPWTTLGEFVVMLTGLRERTAARWRSMCSPDVAPFDINGEWLACPTKPWKGFAPPPTATHDYRYTLVYMDGSVTEGEIPRFINKPAGWRDHLVSSQWNGWEGRPANAEKVVEFCFSRDGSAVKPVSQCNCQ